MNVTRKIDALGRVVIPKEVREALDLKGEVQMCFSGESLVLRKKQTSCLFCGSVDGLVNHEHKQICSECIKKLNAKM